MYPAAFDYHAPGTVKEALELLGKTPELALFIDRKEVSGPRDVETMSDQELIDFIRRESAELGLGPFEAKAAQGSGPTGGKPN